MVSKRLHDELGVDVNRQWQQWGGDLVLVEGEDNVYQAIFNRLSCRYGDMAYFYSDYGSKIYEWLCSPMYEQNLDLLAEEVSHRVLEDPRVSKCDVLLEKYSDSLVNIHVECIIRENGNFSGNFVLNPQTNQLFCRGGEKTYMRLTLGRWTCSIYDIPIKEVRVEDTIKVLTQVTNQFDNGIPIGVVDFYMGNKFLQSVDVDRDGYATLAYTIPTGTPIGTYDIIAHYRGIGRFASVKEMVQVKIVNKYTTITKYIQKVNYGVRGEQICLPTSVKDINGGNVTEGEVYHYLNITELYKLGTKLTIDSVYKQVDDPHCVLHGATLIDGWGDPVECGLVNFYIGNGIGLLRATKSTIDNTFTTETPPQTGLYNARVIDERGANVFYGDFSWYLRKYHGGLNTTVTLPESQTMFKAFTSCIFGNVIDEDNLPVADGDLEFFIRKTTICKPWFSKTTLDYASILEEQLDTVMSALVTDLDGFMVDSGEVDFSYDNTPLTNLDPEEEVAIDISSVPLSFETTSNIASPYMRAMITDEDGNVIDVGDFITEETSNGRVSTYVSSNDKTVKDDGEMINFKLRGNDTNGEEEDR